MASRDSASVIHTARAIACAYVGALVGGYLFEAARAVPAALAAHRWGPVLHPGRAAYGGLLGAIAAATLYLARRPPAAGAVLRSGGDRRRADVRAGAHRLLPGRLRLRAADGAAVGCAVSAGQLGRAGSRAARVRPARRAQPARAPDAALRGGAGAAGRRRRCRFVCGGIAAETGARSRRSWRSTPRDVSSIELVRGDQDRGTFLALSTAQWVSVAIFGGLFVWWRRRRQSVGDLSAVGTAFANRSAKNSALRACAGSIEKSGTGPGTRSLA